MTVSLVGSTGSIGTQALEVMRGVPRPVRRGGARRPPLGRRCSAAQARRFRPDGGGHRRPVLAPDAGRGGCPPGIEVVAGTEGLAAIATVADVVVNGVVGFAGLPVTLAALEAGRRLALANKESIIAGAPVVQRARRTPGAEIIPVDSEHCAIHQCLRAGRRPTTWPACCSPPRAGRSGAGPATSWPRSTVADALAHPTWSMGPKITVDSSTLMNKGLEVIEAHELFGVPYDAIDVVVHPQSIVHSMVEFVDGATVAQLSLPDMRLPIGYALAYPERLPARLRRHRLDRALGPRVRAARPRASSPASTWPTGPAGPGTWPRPGSTPPTRWRWPPSWPAGSAGRPSPRWWRAPSTATTPPAVGAGRRRAAPSTDVLEADAAARRVAERGASPDGRRREHHRAPRPPSRPAPGRGGRRPTRRPRRRSRPGGWPASWSPPSPPSWPWPWSPGTSTC